MTATFNKMSVRYERTVNLQCSVQLLRSSGC